MTEHDFQLEFFVKGNPKAQARPRFGKYGNTYSPKTDWYRECLSTAIKHKPKKPVEFGVALELYFNMPKPKGVKKSEVAHIKRPDYDNLAKAVTDAIVKAGVLKDDNIVSIATISKMYENPVGCKIVIKSLRSF